jgi:hypothetical protein
MLLSCRFGFLCANGTASPVELAGLDAVTGQRKATAKPPFGAGEVFAVD